MTTLHVELAQFKSRFGEQVRALRPKLYGADDHMDESVVEIQALKATLSAYDWSEKVREQAAEYCGVDLTAANVIKNIASEVYRDE